MEILLLGFCRAEEGHPTSRCRRREPGALSLQIACPLLILSVGKMGRSSCSPAPVYSAYSRLIGMQTRVQKWGNSHGVRIPRGLADEVGLVAGTEVSLSSKDGQLVVTPALPARLSLDDLLAGVSESNIHTSIDTGSNVGAEIF